MSTTELKDMSIRALKEEAMKFQVDVTGMFEKEELVKAVQAARDEAVDDSKWWEETRKKIECGAPDSDEEGTQDLFDCIDDRVRAAPLGSSVSLAGIEKDMSKKRKAKEDSANRMAALRARRDELASELGRRTASMDVEDEIGMCVRSIPQPF